MPRCLQLTPVLVALALGLVAFYHGPGAKLYLLPPFAALTLGLLAHTGLSRLRQGRLSLPRDPLTAALALYLAALLAASLWSPWSESGFLMLWSLLPLPLYYLLLRWGLRNESQWHALLPSVGAVLAVFAGYGLWQVASGAAARAHGPLYDPNAFAALLNAGLIYGLFRLAATVERGGRAGVADLALPVLLCGALLVTGSRGALLVALLSAAAMLVLVLLRAKRAHRVLAHLLLVAAAGWALAAALPGEVGAIQRLDGLAQNEDVDPARLMLWKSTLAIYRDHPLTGTGLGTFALYYPAYRDPAERVTFGYLAHNDYLQLLQEGGPLLLLGFAAVWLSLIGLLLRRVLAAGRGGLDWDGVGAGAAALSLAAHAAVNFIFYVAPLALLAGVLLARCAARLQNARWLDLKLGLRRGVAGSVAALLSAVLVAMLVLDATSAVLFQQQGDWPWVEAVRQDRAALTKAAQRLHALRPGSSPPLLYLAAEAQRRAEFTLDAEERARLRAYAAERLLRALALRPRNAEIARNLARLLIEAPELSQRFPPALPHTPEELLELAHRWEPAAPAPVHELALLRIRDGQRGAALELLQTYLARWGRVYHAQQQQRLILIRLAERLAAEAAPQ